MNAYYVEAPKPWDGVGKPAIFLAGGITNCPNWQADARYMIGNHATILNPRRFDFDLTDPLASRQQIEWEFEHLDRATVVLFWFTGGESVQPITLYELGRHAALGRPLAVGADPEYKRREDVYHQLRLARPDIHLWATLSHTCMDAITQVEGG